MDPGDNLEVEARKIKVNVFMSEQGMPTVEVECPLGLSIHHYNRNTDVRQGAESTEPHLLLVAHERA